MYPSPAFVNNIVDSVTSHMETVSKNVTAAVASMSVSMADPLNQQGGCSSRSSQRPSIPSASGSFPRDDEITVSVIYQAVKDTFALKKSVSVSTVSGAIKIEVVPSPTPSSVLVRKLDTQTVSGAHSCSLSSSLGPFLLDSSHTSVSGAIKLSYPTDWCGIIELFLMTGSYKLDSSLGDVRVISDVWDHAIGGRKIVALKGNPREGEEFSTLKIKTKSGSIKVSFEVTNGLRDMTAEEARAEESEMNRQAPSAINKEGREKTNAAVTRAATAETAESSSSQVDPFPQGHGQHQPPAESGPRDLPPSYEQSEAENVLSQLAGRD